MKFIVAMLFSAYTKANLAKYLPGNVGHYIARQMFGAQIGLGQLHLALASLFEIGYSALSMLVLGLLFSASSVITLLQERFNGVSLVWIVAIIVAGAVILFVLGWVFRRNRYVTEIIILASKPRFWLIMFGSLALMSGSIASYFIGFVTPGVPGE